MDEYMNQRSRSASVVSIGERCASVSVGFHFSKARESLEKAKNSGDFHELQAALDAATLLPKANAGSDDSAALTIEVMLAREAMNEQTDDSEMKMKLRNSVALNLIIKQFWSLMEMESKCHHEQHVSDNWAPLEDGKVVQQGYEAIHTRINKTIWKPGGRKWSKEDAHTAAGNDWDADIARFDEGASITKWFNTVQKIFSKNAADAVSRHGFAALFESIDTDGDGPCALCP